MSKNRKAQKIKAEIIRGELPIRKSDEPTGIKESEDCYGEWIPYKAPLKGLKNLVTQSSILPQCIAAYAKNIAGFGLGVRYKEDVQDTKNLEEEFNRLQSIVELLSLDCDIKEVFEQLVEARETYGIAYLEVLRDSEGKVESVYCLNNIHTVEKSRESDETVMSDFYYRGEKIVRRKRFRKYRQRINAKTVYFKEFGDKRIMDKNTGEYVDTKTVKVEISDQANEILEFRLGSEPYGEVRWIGQILNIDGSRKAENLNKTYFENGRHTPLAILIKGGTLTDKSFNDLQVYMNDIKGEAGQHSFMLLEAEKNENSTGMTEEKTPEIEIKNLADILQHDELFQDYLENSRKKVQSAFRLPDLYLGYTTDFNRATAQTAMEVTEKQVFQTERQSLAWIINNKLLNEYGFMNVEVYFKEPDITNPDDLFKMLTVANNAGGLTPNKAKEILYSQIGETSDDFEEEWGNTPVIVSRNTISSLDTAIMKAQNADENTEIISVMKSVRSMLRKMNKGG